MEALEELRSMLFLPDDVAASAVGRGLASEAGLRLLALSPAERAQVLDGVDVEALPRWAKNNLLFCAKQAN